MKVKSSGSFWISRSSKITLDEAVKQLPLDERTIKKLEKKLKGKKFETDKKNLMNIGGMSERDASDYAYLIMEAAVWQEFETMLKLNNITEKEDINELLKLISASVHVNEQEKVSIK